MGVSDFFRSKGEYQVSDLILNHPLKDKYFYRLMQFRTTGIYDVMIMAIDSKSPRVITFDPWPQLIFLGATGLKTVHQFTIEMAKGYKGEVPPLLEKTIIEEIEKLITENVIAISDDKVFLPKELLYPYDKK